jgi:hypothetical protein
VFFRILLVLGAGGVDPTSPNWDEILTMDPPPAERMAVLTAPYVAPGYGLEADGIGTEITEQGNGRGGRSCCHAGAERSDRARTWR